nr:MAG TPA: hypothetical protein [Caudoviricetes sp.]
MSMMENLEKAINGSKGYENTFFLTLTDENNETVKNVKPTFVMGEYNILGTYDEENQGYWFTIPAELAVGSYMYSVTVDGETLMFPDKIRFK